MALKWLRDQMKYLSWVLWGVVITFIVALFFDFGTVDLGPQSDQVAATVGTEKITYADFRSAYQSLEDQYREMFGEQWSSDMAKQFNLQKQALDRLVNQRILLMEAERVGLSVTDAETQLQIVTFPGSAETTTGCTVSGSAGAATGWAISVLEMPFSNLATL